MPLGEVSEVAARGHRSPVGLPILPHALVEWVTMLLVTREGGRRCKLPPHQCARRSGVPRRRDTLARIAAGSGTSADNALPTRT
ncbi:hypothetical protein GCM10010245_88110 [Streptomyces spectabilis]|nr:hypothetical protein GCM10010245_88110 [Streptomyces spectabilis]